MIRRLVDLIRSIGSIAVIAGIVGGAPWLLWQFAGPPGARIIDALGDQLASDTTQTEALLAGALLVIAWACWAQVAYALILEIVAAVRGLAPRRAAVLPGVQALAARLVAATTLLAGIFGPGIQVAAAAPLAPLTDSPADLDWTAPQPVAPVLTLVGRTTAVEASGPMLTTQNRDTFWSIAEDTLGDGLRWSEIRDANIGRSMPDGTTIGNDTESIQPGWTLRLPAGAVARATDPTPSADVEEDNEREVEVREGDHLWGIAEDAMTEHWGRAPSDAELAPYWADVVELNDDRLLPPENPDLIYPGQVFELPPIPADPTAPPPAPIPENPAPPVVRPQIVIPPQPTEPPATPTATPTPTATATVAPEINEVVEPSIDASTEESGVPALAVVAGLGALATGAGALAVTLRRRRNYQSMKREPGAVIEEPTPEAAQYEDKIRPIADTDAIQWIEATNKLMSHRLAAADTSNLPAIVAMRAGALGVEILLDDECQPPEGFEATPEGPTTWRLDPSTELAAVNAEAGGAHPYAPALLPVGRTPAGEVLLDFEQIASLSVAGEAGAIVGWFRGLALAAAVTPWASLCQVVAIGLPDDLVELPNVTAPPDIEVWADRLEAEMTKLRGRLAASPSELRVRSGEVFHPTIVLVGAGHEPLARRLADLAGFVNTPLAVVAAAPLATPELVQITTTSATLEPFGLDFAPVIAPPVELTHIAALLHQAEAPATEPLEPAPEAEGEAGTDGPAPAPEPDQPLEPVEPVDDVIARIMEPKAIEVSILGDRPKVHGLGQEPPMRQLSVISYLAYHRRASSQRVRETFWAAATNRSTADNGMSQVRTLLGTDDSGENRLTTATNTGNYELSDDVGCDWGRAAELIELAAGREPADAIALLAAGLELVAGVPGCDADGTGFAWLVEDYSVYGHIQTTIVDAAYRLGSLALDANDLDRANWAADKGLAILPGHEALYRIKLRVAAARDDYPEVERLYTDLCTHLADGTIWGGPERETEQIVEEARLRRAS